MKIRSETHLWRSIGCSQFRNLTALDALYNEPARLVSRAGSSFRPGGCVFMVVRIGSEAPDFTLKGTGGETFTLSETRGKKRTLLVFYPVDQTPGCRNQLSAISDAID